MRAPARAAFEVERRECGLLVVADGPTVGAAAERHRRGGLERDVLLLTEVLVAGDELKFELDRPERLVERVVEEVGVVWASRELAVL